MTADHPEDWSRRSSREAINRALNRIDAEAGEHNAEYAAGICHARLLLEKELKG